jgi:GAF domain-containing protein
MLKRLWLTFTPPRFENDEKTRSASLLYTILLPVILVTLTIGILDTTLSYLRVITGLLLVMELITLILVRQGRVYAASLIFVSAAWLTVVAITFALGGLNSTIISYTLIIILIAGILMGERTALVFALLNLVIATILLYLQSNNLLPEILPQSEPFRRWTTYIAAYFLVTVLLHIFLTTNRNALLKLKRSEVSLARSNLALREIQTTLEERIQQRTEALKRRANQFKVAAEVSHAAASIRDLDALLSTVAHLISERFGFYHVGIFLLDSEREYAVLQTSNSPGGQRMLSRHHRLKVAELGIVGQVTSTAKAHIALDVGKDAVFFNNPDLPETRSEMALPLLAGEKVLGALDIQSQQQNAFSEEDLSVMQVLADQLAIAIHNAILAKEQQSAMEAVRRAYQQLSRQGWEEFLSAHPEPGYISKPGGTARSDSPWTEYMRQASKTGKVAQAGSDLAVPIKIRNTTTGIVRLKKPDQTAWSEKELNFIQEVTDQIGQALEAARLYTETQRRAERERLTSEIVNRLRATNEPKIIIETALHELRQALGVRKAQVLFNLDTPTTSPEGNGRLSHERPDPDTKDGSPDDDLEPGGETRSEQR